MRVALRNNSFPHPFFLPQGEQQEKERARRAEFLNGQTDATSPAASPRHRRLGAAREAVGGRQGPPSRLSSSQKLGWASRKRRPRSRVILSPWAATLAFRLLTWGGWVPVALPPAFRHSWARAASSTTDSSGRSWPRGSFRQQACAGRRQSWGAGLLRGQQSGGEGRQEPRDTGGTVVWLLLSCEVPPRSNRHPSR
ncbi:uncharacterized protein LOC120244727 isoform X2 [Hyaena hyaena]|uniref:uncharacterized protein LOC120244727 isoform X2 n=1 Tax=Hyaena hyaena TaxID=95912 RepID=UPI001922F789|nr:uncharacterized protein LOC120244727 isoform X2 [Hyaena hyaena]